MHLRPLKAMQNQGDRPPVISNSFQLTWLGLQQPSRAHNGINIAETRFACLAGDVRLHH